MKCNTLYQIQRNAMLRTIKKQTWRRGQFWILRQHGFICAAHKYIYNLLWKYIPLCGENTKYILCLFLGVQKYAGAQYLERRGERRDGKLIDRTIKEKQGSWRSVNILISIKRKYSVTFVCAMRGLSSGFYFHQFPTQIWTWLPQCRSALHKYNTSQIRIHCKYEWKYKHK